MVRVALNSGRIIITLALFSYHTRCCTAGPRTAAVAPDASGRVQTRPHLGGACNGMSRLLKHSFPSTPGKSSGSSPTGNPHSLCRKFGKSTELSNTSLLALFRSAVSIGSGTTHTHGSCFQFSTWAEIPQLQSPKSCLHRISDLSSRFSFDLF